MHHEMFPKNIFSGFEHCWKHLGFYHAVMLHLIKFVLIVESHFQDVIYQLFWVESLSWANQPYFIKTDFEDTPAR